MFERIRAICPEESSERFVYCELEDDDTRLAEILKLLTENGFVRKNPAENQAGMRVFEMERERVYRVADLRAAPYLEPTPTHDFDVEYRNDRGEFLLMSCFLRGKRQIGFASMSLVVSASMRGKLEAMSFHNLVFRPVLVDEKPTSDWWEVTSALTMPPVCPSCELHFFESGKPFDGD